MTAERWAQLMQALGLPQSVDTFVALLRAYGEKHRAYHNAAHIAACLRLLDEVADSAARPREIELALWFHDAIYRPFSSHNEQRSADWAARFLRGCAAPAAMVERICAMIMATRHSGAVAGGDQALLVDIDLSILGASPDVYAQFEHGVRREYRWVPRWLYRRQRRQLLAGFLARNSIYHCADFRERFEAHARSNLQRALAELA